MMRQSLLIAGLVVVGGLLAGCFHDMPGNGNGNGQPPAERALQVSVTAPEQAQPNQPFTVAVTVSTSKSLPAISLRADFDGLSLVDKGDFMSVNQTVAQAAIVQPSVGEEQTLEIQLQCTESIEYAVTGIAESKDIQPVWSTVNISCAN